jgi:hypothetical protein
VTSGQNLKNSEDIMRIKVDPDWWKTLFDEVYLLTDARSVCDARITRREVDLICSLLPMKGSHKILDLCGGHGRRINPGFMRRPRPPQFRAQQSRLFCLYPL